MSGRARGAARPRVPLPAWLAAAAALACALVAMRAPDRGPGRVTSPAPVPSRASALASRAGMRCGSGWLVEGFCMAVALDRDGRRVASAGDRNPAGARVWDLSSRQVALATARNGGLPVAVALAPGGKRLAQLLDRGSLQVAAVPAVAAPGLVAAREVGRLPDTGWEGDRRTVGFLADGRAFAATADGTRVLLVREGDAGPSVLPAPGGMRAPLAIQLDAAGQLLASVDDSGWLQVWDVAAGRPVFERRELVPYGMHWALGAQGTLLACARPDASMVSLGDIELIELPSGRVRHRIAIPPEKAAAVAWMAFSSDASTLVIAYNIAGLGMRLEWVRTSDGKLIKQVTRDDALYTHHAVSGDGRVLAARRNGGPIEVFGGPPDDGADPGAAGLVCALAFDVDGALFAAAVDRRLRIWRTETGTLERPPIRLSFMADRIWFAASGQRVNLSGEGRLVSFPRAAPPDRPVSEPGAPAVRDDEAWDPAIALPGGDARCRARALTLAVAGDGDGRVLVRDAGERAPAWREVGRLAAAATAVAADPVHRQVAAGSEQGEVRAWALPEHVGASAR